MSLLYHAYVYLEFLILACTIYILAPILVNDGVEIAVMMTIIGELSKMGCQAEMNSQSY